MPWCDPCDAFYNPGSLGEDGTCPRCGGPVTEGDLARDRRQLVADVDEPDAAEEGPHIPWHFWVGVVAMVLYLGWRVIQGFLLLF